MSPKAKKVGAAVLAAVSTPDAVKAEKAVGVLVAVRVALALGAGLGTVDLIQKIVNSL